MNNHNCMSGSQCSKASDPLSVNIQAFLTMPRKIDALRHELLMQRKQQAEQHEQLCGVNHSVQSLSDRFDSIQTTLACLAENVPAINQSLRHIASSNEQLNETFYRKRIATPLGASVVGLLELIDRMDLEQTDTDIRRMEIENLLAQFSMELFIPTPGTAYDPKTMTGVSHATSDTPVVHKLIRPGIIYRSECENKRNLRQAAVSLIEEGITLSRYEPAVARQDEEGPQRREPGTKQVAMTNLQ